MIALPLPMIFAAVIGYLLVRDLSAGRPAQVFHGLLALCALQSALIALGHHYGLPLGAVLPVTACALPPLAWLAFREALFEGITLRRALPHATAPLLALLARVALPWMLDVLVPLTFAAYALAILWALRRGSALPLARLEAGPLPALTWRALGLALLFSTLGDVIITLGYLTGHPDWHGPVVSLVTSLSLLLVALLALDPQRVTVASRDGERASGWDGGWALKQNGPDADSPPDRANDIGPVIGPVIGPDMGPDTPPDLDTRAEDALLMARLDRLMVQDQMFLEPDLTLARLARRLVVPAKRLSVAINRATGENVSRYVNGHRIGHACTLLQGGLPVTEVIYACGFNTKSNFNREFLRVTGRAPSAWGT